MWPVIASYVSRSDELAESHIGLLRPTTPTLLTTNRNFIIIFKFATLNEVSNIHERTNTRSSAIPSGCGGTSEGVVLAVVVIVMAGLVVMVVGGCVTFRGTGGVPHWTVTADHADTAHHETEDFSL